MKYLIAEELIRMQENQQNQVEACILQHYLSYYYYTKRAFSTFDFAN